MGPGLRPGAVQARSLVARRSERNSLLIFRSPTRENQRKHNKNAHSAECAISGKTVPKDGLSPLFVFIDSRGGYRESTGVFRIQRKHNKNAHSAECAISGKTVPKDGLSPLFVFIDSRGGYRESTGVFRILRDTAQGPALRTRGLSRKAGESFISGAVVYFTILRASM